MHVAGVLYACNSKYTVLAGYSATTSAKGDVAVFSCNNYVKYFLDL